MDMHSGGGRKEPYAYIFIQAPEAEAKSVFYARFGHNPDRVSCTCCGADYSITQESSLTQGTAYERGCAFDDDTDTYVERPEPNYKYKSYVTVDEFIKRGSALIIPASEIRPQDRNLELPEQGYVWKD